MKIVVTNDDGVYAKGLWSLVKALTEVAEVVVVAPDREQSGVGTAVTLHAPVRVTPVAPLLEGVATFSVQGTPADCVILALRQLLKEPPDLVMAGINDGSNLGNDVLISGTVGGAFQGYFHGLPAVALSVAALENLHYEVAACLGCLLARRFAEKALPHHAFLNVNVPNVPLQEIKGIELTRLGRRSYEESVTEDHDGRRHYYWILRGTPASELDEGTDIWALKQNRISITPLDSNLTGNTQEAGLAGLSATLFEGLRCQP